MENSRVPKFEEASLRPSVSIVRIPCPVGASRARLIRLGSLPALPAIEQVGRRLEFDDDTDLPLPNMSLPNLGTKGAILEALSDDSDDQGDSGPGPASGPATPSHAQFNPRTVNPEVAFNEVKDITPYKKCASVSSLCGRRDILSSSGGSVYTLSISMRSGRMVRGSVVLRVRRPCGGHSVET